MPPDRPQLCWDRFGTEPSRAGEPEAVFSSCMPGVNLSPDSNNIFSQPQKRRTTRGSNEPARVDAPGRASSKAGRRRVALASARSAVRRATLACTLVSIGMISCPSPSNAVAARQWQHPSQSNENQYNRVEITYPKLDRVGSAVSRDIGHPHAVDATRLPGTDPSTREGNL